MKDPALILVVLCVNVAVCEWLVRHTFCKHLGTALLVILVTAVQANMGLIPTASNAPPLYPNVFHYMAPIGLFYLLLEVNLGQLRKAGPAMVLMFLIGSAATVVGVVVGLWLVDARATLGPSYAALGGMFTGTYTGGSINFNAVALHYRVVEEGALYTGALAVDNIMTSVWMMATLILPRVLSGVRNIVVSRPTADISPEQARHEHDVETVGPTSLGVVIALGLVAFWVSDQVAGLLSAWGLEIPSILVITTIALVLAQLPVFGRLPGGRLLGMFCIYIFLAVIGAHAELAALGALGHLGLVLVEFALTLVVCHGLIIFGAGALLRQDWDVVAVASQANIGGSTSALALAKSLGRVDLLLPAILVGSLGNAIGTYLGFAIAGILGAGAAPAG